MPVTVDESSSAFTVPKYEKRWKVDILWGVVLIACGVFVSVYGSVLFRFALAALGFGLGAIAAWWLTGDQSEAMRILISLAAGGILAAVLYALVRIGIYVAGGMLGLVLALLLVAVLDIESTAVDTTLLIAGTGLAGFFGPRMGRKIIAVAMAAAGAFQVVYGLSALFAGQMTADISPTDLLGSPLALAVFIVVAAISILSQLQPRIGVVRAVR